MYQSNKLHTIMNQPLSRLFVNIDVKCNCYFCSAINTVYLPVVNSHWSSEHMRQTATTYGSVFRPMLTRCSFNTVIFESRLKSKWKTKQILVIKKQHSSQVMHNPFVQAPSPNPTNTGHEHCQKY